MTSESTDQTRVLVVGSMPLSLEAISIALADGSDYMVESVQVEDASAGVRRIRGLKPDVAVLDVFGRESGEAIRELIQETDGQHAEPSIVVLSHQVDSQLAQEIVRSGKVSYVHKSSGLEELKEAVHEAVSGRQFLSSKVAIALVNRSLAQEAEVLSPREVEVLALVARGLTNSEIADTMFLSVRTVEAYRANIQSKLGISRRSQLFEAAVERGLLEGPIQKSS